MRGKHWSEEVKQKLRAANVGQKRSAETRKKPRPQKEMEYAG